MRRQEEVRERHLLEVKVYVHCPKTELNLCKLTEPVGWSRCNGICMAYLPNICACCILTSCDRLGFYSKIHFNFGTVY